MYDMDASKIIRQVIFFLFLGHNVHVSSLTMQTKDVFISQRDNRIILNCTYNKEIGEQIPAGSIRWQKKIVNTFKDIAIFSPPPNLQQPFIIKEMNQIYNNRTELIVRNTSMAAVMIINNPVCKDGGIYRCLIKYFSDNSEKNQTSGSVVKFIAEAKEPEEIVVFPEKLDENQSLSLTCSADVGSPQGYIQILKFFENSDRLDLIYKSNSTINKTENCTKYINVTATYTVTREDNGAVFRCSSQNGLTQGPGRSRESNKISVLYGPDETTIILTPNKSVYTVGDHLTIQCLTISNPPPAFKWYFRRNGTSEESPIGRTSTNGKLEFDKLHATSSGTYICTVINEARSNSPNATTHVSVSVRIYHDCNQCRLIEICQQNYEKIECIPNDWVPTALVFMTVSVAFAVSSIFLCINRKRSQETIAVNTVNNTSPHPYDAPEDNVGAYASPSDFNRTQEAGCSSSENICDAYSQSKDFIKKQEHSLLLTHHNEPDRYTTTQDVVQYAAVQKKPTKDQVSDENVYDSAWNSDNVFFKLRPETQGPHRSPEQQ